MPGDSGVLVVTRVRSTTTKCTRDRGCIGHPAFPTPSLGGRFINASGASRREDVNARSKSGIFVGWAKRSVPTSSHRAVGTAQRAPLPTLRKLNFLHLGKVEWTI